ncbi:hypothetical protein [Frigoriglobus tundricola]|uniref:Lipoprotein n=1 Tax=Frigoriglobus tundricola TaxID=2774151 RepID=A0A6M5Z0P1_9BACT|nr:hypothetical protein [Frigoriglobus tundricola]QJW99728.1 hypothetical protein FTUN_7351 [Frigoriglobus tundricola]
MRGIMLRALPVCVAAFATGCFLTNSSVGPATSHNTPTHAYWHEVGAVLTEKSTGNDMKDLLPFIRNQTEKLRTLSTDGVDPALVAAVADLVKCEDEVLRRADMAGEDPSVMRSNKEVAAAFAEANRLAFESKKRLAAMRDSLNDRLGGGFGPINVGGTGGGGGARRGHF